jgi:hypothetical protein
MQKKAMKCGEKQDNSANYPFFLQIKHIEYVDQNPTGRSSRSNWLRISKHTMTWELYAKENHRRT